MPRVLTINGDNRTTQANVLAESQRGMLTTQIQQWLGSASKQDRALGFDLLKNLGEVPRHDTGGTQSHPGVARSCLAWLRAGSFLAIDAGEWR